MILVCKFVLGVGAGGLPDIQIATCQRLPSDGREEETAGRAAPRWLAWHRRPAGRRLVTHLMGGARGRAAGSGRLVGRIAGHLVLP